MHNDAGIDSDRLQLAVVYSAMVRQRRLCDTSLPALMEPERSRWFDVSLQQHAAFLASAERTFSRLVVWAVDWRQHVNTERPDDVHRMPPLRLPPTMSVDGDVEVEPTDSFDLYR